MTNKISYPPKNEEEIAEVLREWKREKKEENPKSEATAPLILGLWSLSILICLVFFLFGFLELIQNPQEISSAFVFAVIPAILVVAVVVQALFEEIGK